MSTLGSSLVRNQVVGVTQIEKALQRQVIYGGDLATNLLELDVIDEDVLAEYTGHAFGMPVLSRQILEEPDERILRMVPWSVATEHRIVPVSIEDKRMIVACSAPLAESALEDISFLLDVEIVPNFVLDFRLSLALNRCYGLVVSARHLELKKRLAPDVVLDQPPLLLPTDQASEIISGEDPRRPTPEAPTEEAVPTEKSDSEARESGFDESLKMLYTEQNLKGAEAAMASSQISDKEEKGPEPPHDIAAAWTEVESQVAKKVTGDVPSKRPPLRDKAQTSKLVHLDIDRAQAALKEAQDRDTILSLFLEYCSEVFDYSALFVVHGRTAEGRSSVSKTGGTKNIRDFSIPLDEKGMFATAFDTRSFYFGAPGTTEYDQAALQSMGRERPPNCAILPVILNNRVILLLYGDAGLIGVQPDHMADLTRLTHLVAEAFEHLLLKRKYGTYKKGFSSIPARPVHPVLSKLPPEADSSQSPWSEPKEPVGDTVPSQEGVLVENIDSPGTYASRQGFTRIDSISPKKHSTRPPVMEKKREDDIQQGESPGEYFSNKSFSKTDSMPPPVRTSIASRRSEKNLEPKMERRVLKQQIVSVESRQTGRSVIVEMKEEIDRLVERILTSGKYDSTAADLLVGIGKDALPKIMEHFPGPLYCDRYQEAANLPSVSDHGPLLRTLVRFGKTAVPFITPLFDKRDSDVRFYAVYLFSELRVPSALDSLIGRIFDSDRQIRELATKVVRGFDIYPEYRRAVKGIIGRLGDSTSSLDVKRTAATALGDLGESTAVPVLAHMLGSADGVLVERTHRALVKITFSDFGFSERRWSDWWENHKDGHRIQWAIDALGQPRETVWMSSLEELRRMLKDKVSIPDSLPNAKERQELQNQLRVWWKTEGLEIYYYTENE